jgi:hypothetical protein
MIKYNLMKRIAITRKFKGADRKKGEFLKDWMQQIQASGSK